MTAPAYVLSVDLFDLVGNSAGTTANPAKMRICLCGFGPALPYVANTAMLAKVGPTDFFSTGSAIDITLFGNDQITPAGTYYSIEILDGEDNVVQCGAYSLTGAGGGGLPAPILPPIPPQPGGLVLNELAGAVPGNTFTLPTPAYLGVVIALVYRGVIYPPAGNWSLSGNTLTTTFVCTAVPYALYQAAS